MPRKITIIIEDGPSHPFYTDSPLLPYEPARPRLPLFPLDKPKEDKEAVDWMETLKRWKKFGNKENAPTL